MSKEIKEGKVFVFGTLLKGCGLYSNISDMKDNVISTTPAVTEGVMYSNGAYPMVKFIPGNAVIGEIVTFKDIDFALERLDRVEGFMKGRENNLYNRIIVPVLPLDSSMQMIDCWTYDYNHSFEGQKYVPSGSWRIHIYDSHAMQIMRQRANEVKYCEICCAICGEPEETCICNKIDDNFYDNNNGICPYCKEELPAFQNFCTCDGYQIAEEEGKKPDGRDCGEEQFYRKAEQIQFGNFGMLDGGDTRWHLNCESCYTLMDSHGHRCDECEDPNYSATCVFCNKILDWKPCDCWKEKEEEPEEIKKEIGSVIEEEITGVCSKCGKEKMGTWCECEKKCADCGAEVDLQGICTACENVEEKS